MLVSELARRQVSVCLSGDGADELFGGYNRHVWVPWLGRLAACLPAAGRARMASALAGRPAEQWDRVFSRLTPVLPRALRFRTPGEKIHKLAAALGSRSGAELYDAVISQWTEPVALGCGRLARSGDVLDVVAADRDESGNPLRPQCRDDTGGAAAPIIAGECRALDAERVEQIQEIAAECGLLADHARALAVQKWLRAEYPDEHHADCDPWAVWQTQVPPARSGEGT